MRFELWARSDNWFQIVLSLGQGCPSAAVWRMEMDYLRRLWRALRWRREFDKEEYEKVMQEVRERVSSGGLDE